MQKIILKGISHHNLQNIDAEIPHNSFTVVTGVSGSGKSTFAIDVLYRAAERSYIETYSVYARQFLNKLHRPEVEHISGLCPGIHLEQKNYIRSARSTIGTMSGLHDVLRLLFARLGKSKNKNLNINRSLFSFNKPEGACSHCKGLGIEERINPNLLISDENKTLREGTLLITTPTGYTVYSQVTIDVMNQICNSEGFSTDIPWKDLTEAQKNIVLYGSDKIKVLFGKHSLESRMKWKGITAKPRKEGYYKGIVPVMEEILKRDRNKNILRFVQSQTCEKCSGSRFNAQALSVLFQNKNIADLLSLSIADLNDYFKNITFPETEKEVGDTIKNEIINKTQGLIDLGLSYLHLNRNATTLSGSEASRIRLNTRINNGLHSVLYVFDEPAAGLHASDMNNLLKKIIELRDAGNTVVVIDHNEQIIHKADYIIELGPGAGINGGKILYQGPVSDWKTLSEKLPESKTAAFLSGNEKINKLKNHGNGKYLKITGAKARNLKNIDVSFPLNCISVVTGVSGTGKSSLLKYTLANYLRVKLQNSRLKYGEFEQIEGLESINKIIETDQSPIGKTSRSNPATYIKLFDEIRGFYSKLPQARKLNFKKLHFSFNTKGGRCETCQGAGYISAGMHFLENTELICPDCNGKRFHEDLLSVKYRNKSIYDVLEMSVSEAIHFFNNVSEIMHYLQVLNDLGLGYLKLGQRSSTLSGGEAQRIKIASELSRSSSGNTLYILDEPTRGLHLYDIKILFKALQKLIDRGNTIIVIEHNLHFINAADYVVDIGPGSGTKGGELIFSGLPADLLSCKKSLTGIALKKMLNEKQAVFAKKLNQIKKPAITFKGISTNNLKNIDIEIPNNKFIVFTGVSGSGKSSLLYDTIYAESRRIFNESFSAYVRTKLGNLKKADFDQVNGLTPVIALEQKRLKANDHSTVGTLTEIYDYFRLMYSRIGQMRFPDIADKLTAAHFSFNQSQGWCTECGGLGFKKLPDAKKVITNPEKSLLNGALDGTKTGKFYGEIFGQFVAILKVVGKEKNIDFSKAWNDLTHSEQEIAFLGCNNEIFDVEWNFKRGNRQGVQRFKSEWIGFSGYISEEFTRKQADKRAEELLPLMKNEKCSSCNGNRLNSTSLSVNINGRNISELSELCISDAMQFLQITITKLNKAEKNIFEPFANEIIKRLQKIEQVGLSYLSLNRLSNTLSGGEVQRVRLAGILGAELSGITYILDEPSSGLHPSDNENLIKIIKELRDLGNTVLVAEHREEIIRSADYIFDLGEGAGTSGGHIITEGNLESILTSTKSKTAKYLSNDKIPVYRKHKKTEKIALKIKGACANNLKNIDVEFYEGLLNVICGKSGSGKSSLLKDILFQSLSENKAVNCKKFLNIADFENVIFADRNLPVGSSASTVATYSGLFDFIREDFACEAKKTNKKISKSYFSLNVKGGRCEYCKGKGMITISMDFLADAETVCEKCKGKRYKDEALKYKINNKNIAELSEMSLTDLSDFYNTNYSNLSIKQKQKLNTVLEILQKTGLGYLHAGQTLKNLSGGELQRLKLAVKLLKSGNCKTLFLLDEPTSGLHFEDVKYLIILFDELLQKGNTVILTEHHPHIWKNADYLIEMGPGGGEKGGKIISKGRIEDLKLFP